MNNIEIDQNKSFKENGINFNNMELVIEDS